MTNLYDQLDRDRSPLPLPTRVLTIGAHPDDAEFGAGATLARWASHGARVTLCVLTDGSKGSWDPSLDAAELASTRETEQRAAAEVLGASQVVNLGHVDGELESTMDLRKQVASQIRLTRPDVVLSHDPWQRYQLHPDHRAAGLAAVDGVVAAREPRAYPELGEAHRPPVVLLWSADEPDHAEPVTEEWFQRKVEALLCHSSQSGTTMGNAAADAAARQDFVAKLDSWHRTMGNEVGTGPAETFKRLTP